MQPSVTTVLMRTRQRSAVRPSGRIAARSGSSAAGVIEWSASVGLITESLKVAVSAVVRRFTC